MINRGVFLFVVWATSVVLPTPPGHLLLWGGEEGKICLISSGEKKEVTSKGWFYTSSPTSSRSKPTRTKLRRWFFLCIMTECLAFKTSRVVRGTPHIFSISREIEFFIEGGNLCYESSQDRMMIASKTVSSPPGWKWNYRFFYRNTN